ncbi:MAG: substrate-binding domain-containing protein [Bacteroidia bacterium]|nr:substrate-binding domain-containing protein [Bacteroidia bacterium]
MKIRVGGVPEHFNYPWHIAIQQGLFSENTGLSIRWRDVLGGTGSMKKKLVENDLDLALMLTEGAVKAISDGHELKIIGTYVKSPLLWGLHVPADSPFVKLEDLKGQPIAISRKGSGSHLMSFVLAEQMGWALDDLDFVIVKNFDGAKESFVKGESSLFLWEKFTTKPTVDQGEWRRIGEIPTPWPCFVLVARKDVAESRVEELLEIMARVKQARTALDYEETIDYLNKNYQQKKEDLEEWYDQTEWECGPVVSGIDLSQVQISLHDLGLISGIRDSSFYLSDHCRII